MSSVVAHSERELTTSRDGSRPMPGGEVGVWVFIFADMTMFAYMFAMFLVYRGDDVDLYIESSEKLVVGFGVANTLVLLTSSLLVVLALHRFRAGSPAGAARLLAGAIACGVLFAVLKVFEYHHEIASGQGVATNSFFTFYFFLTGLHLMHLVIGVVVIAYLYRLMRRPVLKEWQTLAVEGGACYWHMVDFLWIVIFPLLYLVR